MNMNGKSLVIVNRFEIAKEHIDGLKMAWEASKVSQVLKNSVIYEGISENLIVMLYEVESLDQLQEKLESEEYKAFIKQITPYVMSDFHQEVVGLVDEVVPRDTLVPRTPYMQLRHIEVPLSGIEPYLEWRKRRIFEFVKRNDKVHSFLAFHSFFSTQPGVLFITEFTGDPETYRNSFLTPEYKVIIQEAGHDHIKGGLYTSEFKLLAG